MSDEVHGQYVVYVFTEVYASSQHDVKVAHLMTGGYIREKWYANLVYRGMGEGKGVRYVGD